MHYSDSLDLNLLRIFGMVYREKSITLASHRLGMSQSAVSHSLNRLRTATKDPLFVRTKKGMEPTTFAMQLAKPLMEALATIDESIALKQDFVPANANRTFSIAMTDIGQSIYLPVLVPYLLKHAPSVNLLIHQLSLESLRNRLEAGEINLAIGPLPGLQAGFFQQRLYSSEWICALRKDHPRIQDHISLEQFLSETHLVVAPPGTGQGAVEIYLKKTGNRRRIGVRIPLFRSANQLLAITDMIAVMPSGFLSYTTEGENIRVLPLPFEVESMTIRQFWHERFHTDPEIRWLRSVIMELFSDGSADALPSTS